MDCRDLTAVMILSLREPMMAGNGLATASFLIWSTKLDSFTLGYLSKALACPRYAFIHAVANTCRFSKSPLVVKCWRECEVSVDSA